VIPHVLQGKRLPETPVKNYGRSNGRIKSYGPFEPVLWSRATIPPTHGVAIPHVLQGKRLPETPVKIKGDPTVGSKVMALSNRFAGLERRDLRLIE